MANISQNFKKIDVFYEEQGIQISSVAVSSMDNRITLMGDQFQLIAHQTLVDVIGYLEDGIVLMTGKVTLSTASQLNLDVESIDEKQERRKYLKVKTNFKTRLIKAHALGKRNKSILVNENVEIRDLSLGGACIYSNKTFFKKQRLYLDFSHLKPGFIAEAIVLRREKESYKIGFRYRYGCQFQNLGNEEQRILCEYVFKIQIQNHKRLKENLEDE